MKIDLNADLGEGYGPWRMGDDAAMLGVVSSASIACGGHAGDPETMLKTLRLTQKTGVIAGAHPGYADRMGFGRRVIPMTGQAMAAMIAAQVGALQAVAALAGTRLGYVKPHGALSNVAMDDREVADTIAQTVASLPGGLALLAVSGTELQAAGHRAGIPVFAEIFADRGYLANGRLVPRAHPGAVLHDPDEVADRLLRFLDSGLMPTVDGDPVRLDAASVCIHGDTPGAVDMARLLHARLTGAGISVEPFLADAR